jgi:hypothetical protein
MFRIITLIVVLLLGAALMYGALASHVVRTTKGVVWVSKKELGFKDTYVDIRKWDADDAKKHPDLVERLIEEGHGDALAGEALERLKDLFR